MIDDAWPLAQAMAKVANCPHLELRVQEGDHWDFTLYEGDVVVADFSTNVAYFDSDEAATRPWKQGDANTFANTWGVQLAKVQPYLIDWKNAPEGGVAVSGDRFQIGDWRQVFDFMRVLGVEPPQENARAFPIQVQAWTWCYQRQPLWRRIVRQISVWIRGRYPDLPPLTPEERAEWDRRRASVRVVRVNLGADVVED